MSYYHNPYLNYFINSYNYAMPYPYSAYGNANMFKNNRSTNNLNIVKSGFSKEEAAAIALLLGIDFNKSKFDLDEFWMGVNTELEHGKDQAKQMLLGMILF